MKNMPTKSQAHAALSKSTSQEEVEEVVFNNGPSPQTHPTELRRGLLFDAKSLRSWPGTLGGTLCC